MEQEDDDIMINIAVPKSKPKDSVASAPSNLNNRAQFKKNKYAAKFVKQKKRDHESRQKYYELQKVHSKKQNGLAGMYDDDEGEAYENAEADNNKNTAGGAQEDSQDQKVEVQGVSRQRPKKLIGKPKSVPAERSRDSKSLGPRQRQAGRQTWHRTQADTTPVPIKQRDQIKGIVIPKQLLPSEYKKTEKKDTIPLSQLQLSPNLQKSLIDNNIERLTPIQSQCFQPLSAKKNCVFKAATGSGKTLAYLLPLIDSLLKSGKHINREQGTYAIVICPTRELCIQAEKQTLKCVKKCAYIVPGSLMGGEEIKKEKARLRKGISILFATPGRLDYHLQNTQSFNFKNLSYLIFEEADRTLDMGFKKQISRITTILQEKVEAFKAVQKILVSAHFNEKIEQLLTTLSSEPFEYIGFKKQSTSEEHQEAVSKEINISSQLKQTYVLVSEEQRIPMLIAYLNLLNKCKALIFFSTIDEVEYFEFMFNKMYYRDCNGNYTDQKLQKRTVLKLHGDIDQKIRSTTYFNFRKEQSCILLSTEVASRGLDFPDLTHIILFDIPATITDYANRIGRTARMNSTGVSLLILNYQESVYVEQLKVYTPDITPIDKSSIFGPFSKILEKMNIGTNVLEYLEGIIRGLVKDDEEKYQLARRAYVSMLRAYARLPNKDIFAVKKLNLKYLAKNFGLNSVRSRVGEATAATKKSTMNKDRDYDTLRKMRKIQNVRELQISEYL